MRLLLQAIIVAAIVLGFSTDLFAQNQRNTRIAHRLQVRIYLPEGVQFPEVIRVNLNSETLGQPIQTKNLLRETFTEFTQIPSGEYIIVITADNEEHIDQYTERISLRSNFPLVRQISAFMNKKLGPISKKQPGTIDVKSVNIPKDALKAFERGISKAEKGKTEEAIKAFEEAIKHHPNYVEALNDLGVQYMRAGRYQEAAAQLDRARKLAPESPFPALNLGIVMNEQKRYEEAINVLSEAIRLDFNNPLAHFQLGFACFNTSDWMRAQLEFEITVEAAAQKLPIARLYLADIYKRQSRNNDAINQIETFLRENPNHSLSSVARREIEQLKQPGK
jgi:tetratricopeptide (TPR) repeat protein